MFNDHVLATAILDRLLHHATTLNIKGESYRLKEKRRAGLLGQVRPAGENGKEGASDAAEKRQPADMIAGDPGTF